MAETSQTDRKSLKRIRKKSGGIGSQADDRPYHQIEGRVVLLSEQVFAGAKDEAEVEILHRATEVIGNKGDAMRWMGTPIRALNYATPVSLLHTRKGRDAVKTVLGRLEHGVP
jgi:Protein of unknown function (DUF2384)